jgi:glutamyl-tRNA synthetase
MGQDGAKLSKRHGGVAVEEYKREGFLPEALVNYLLLLGWSPGQDREIVPLSEAVRIFDIKNMKGVQAKFDLVKLRWMNGEYIAAKTGEELLALVKRYMASEDRPEVCDDVLKKVIGLYKVRVKTLSEFVRATDYFFTDDYSKEDKGVEKYLSPQDNRRILREFAGRLDILGEFTHERIEEACRLMAEEKKLKAGSIIHPTRVAISGKTSGAGLFEMMELLGKERVLKRMNAAAAG